MPYETRSLIYYYIPQIIENIIIHNSYLRYNCGKIHTAFKWKKLKTSRVFENNHDYSLCAVRFCQKFEKLLCTNHRVAYAFVM